MKSIVSEYELLEYCRCPLRVSGPPVPKHEFGSRLSTAVVDLVQQAFNSSAPTKPQIIHRLDTVREFNRLQDKKPKNPEDGAAYKARMTVADSLAGIFRSFKVLQPVTKYRLKVGRTLLDGDYAILQNRATPEPMILQIRSDQTTEECPPNIISYARHWHLLTAHEYRDASILSLHIPSGQTRIQWIPIHHSQKFVKAAVEAYQLKIQFPAPGVHCSSCVSQACLTEAVV
jgi:hypothetical protein